MKIAVPGTRTGRSGLSVSTNCSSGIASRARSSAMIRRPRHHVPMIVKTISATMIGNQPPSANLQQVGAEKRQIDDGKQRTAGTATARLLPSAAHVDEAEDRRDRHRRR